MLTGLSGALLSHYFAECLLHVEFAGRLGEQSAPDAHRVFRGWWLERVSQLGPASSLRSVWNVAAVPLSEQLGFAVSAATGDGDTYQALLTGFDARIGLVAGNWSTSLESALARCRQERYRSRNRVVALHEWSSDPTGGYSSDVLPCIPAVRSAAGERRYADVPCSLVRPPCRGIPHGGRQGAARSSDH